MSTTVKTGWLNDKNGDKFAPKTLTSQVQTSDGTLLEDKIQSDLDVAALSARNYSDEQIANSKNTWYGTCPTAASTVAKVATTNTGNFSLTAGNIVYILFTYQNTGSSPTLNIDGTGAIIIKSSASTNVATYQWGANEVIGFVYDGTCFRMIDGQVATTTYYGMTKLSSSTTSTATNLAATPSAVKKAYDLANEKAPAYTYGTTDLTAGSSELETGILYFVYE